MIRFACRTHISLLGRQWTVVGGYGMCVGQTRKHGPTACARSAVRHQGLSTILSLDMYVM